MKKPCIDMGYADDGCERYKCCTCGGNVEMRAEPKFCCFCGAEFSEIMKYTTSVRWKLAVIKKEGGEHPEYHAGHIESMQRVWDPLKEREAGYLANCTVRKEQTLETYIDGDWYEHGIGDDETPQRLRVTALAMKKDEKGRPSGWHFGMARVTYYESVQEHSSC